MRSATMTRTMALTLAVFAAGLGETSIVLADNQESMQMDKAPGPAYTTVDGKVTKIEGEVYTIQSNETDYRGNNMSANEMRLYVGQETKKLHGDKKVGDKIRAEVTRGGFANSIQ